MFLLSAAVSRPFAVPARLPSHLSVCPRSLATPPLRPLMTSPGVAPVSGAVAAKHSRLMFTAEDRVGLLEDALAAFRRHNLNLVDLQTTPSHGRTGFYDFHVTFDVIDPAAVDRVRTDLLATTATAVELLGTTEKADTAWFPRRPVDLDLFARETMEYGAELDADHPGFKDESYRARRAELAQLAKDFRQGDRIPVVAYTSNETATWRTVYLKLKDLFTTNACAEHNRVMKIMEAQKVLSPDSIPQLEDVSNFLRDCTGWTLRPVAGLLSQRDFLNALAFRIFHSTQYIRHHSTPLYTPEPDICHEVLGHIPLLADQDFADFSQELGLASLGASDEDISRLGTLYWFTVEFGMCKSPSGLKAYGAGLLSSFGELEYCMTDKPQKLPFNPWVACTQPFPVTTYQPLYYVTESFEDAKRQMIEFSRSLRRPFAVAYNPYTQAIDVLDNADNLRVLTRRLKGQLDLLDDALCKLENRRRHRVLSDKVAPFVQPS